MKNKRDLWIMAMTTLLIAIVLFVAIGIGTRHQQQAQVKELEDDTFHGRSENVRQLVSTTDVLAREPSITGLFFMAILHCDGATVQTLINEGASPNSRVNKDDKEAENTPMGFTALDFAVVFRRADIVSVLLRNGADANLKTNGQTALDLLNTLRSHGGKLSGTDAQIAHLLREAQLKSKIHP